MLPLPPRLPLPLTGCRCFSPSGGQAVTAEGPRAGGERAERVERRVAASSEIPNQAFCLRAHFRPLDSDSDSACASYSYSYSTTLISYSDSRSRSRAFLLLDREALHTNARLILGVPILYDVLLHVRDCEYPTALDEFEFASRALLSD